MTTTTQSAQPGRVHYTTTYYSGQGHRWCATTTEATKINGRFENQVAAVFVSGYPCSASAKRAAIAKYRAALAKVSA